MASESITKKDLTKLEENLGRIIAKGFNENTEQHQGILAILDKHAVMLINHTEILKDHTERLTRIEKKLENVVYRGEFDELKAELEKIKKVLVEKKIINY